MKKLLLSTAAIAAMGIYAGSAQATDTATASASATVAVPVTIDDGAPMAFGTIAVDVNETATVYTDGTDAVNGQQLGTVNGTSFAVTGEPGMTYTLTADATVDLTGPGGILTADMTYTNANATSALDTSGDDTVYAEGELEIASSVASGTYSGTINVSVDYP